MKTRILKSFLPFVAIVLAVTGALAFKPAPENAALLDVNGFIPGSTCVDSQVLCTTTNNNIHCVSGGMNLYNKISSTSCPSFVWRK